MANLSNFVSQSNGNANTLGGHSARYFEKEIVGGSLGMILSPGGAEVNGKPEEPVLENVIGTYKNWTQLRYPKDINTMSVWTIPPSYIGRYKGGTLNIQMVWFSHNNTGTAKFKLNINTVNINDVIDSSYTDNTKIIDAPVSGVSSGIILSSFTYDNSELDTNGLMYVTLTRLGIQDTLDSDANLLYLSIFEN
jgi:hypothetical protein